MSTVLGASEERCWHHIVSGTLFSRLLICLNGLGCGTWACPGEFCANYWEAHARTSSVSLEAAIDPMVESHPARKVLNTPKNTLRRICLDPQYRAAIIEGPTHADRVAGFQARTGSRLKKVRSSVPEMASCTPAYLPVASVLRATKTTASGVPRPVHTRHACRRAIPR